jgi:hypothetical protein
VTGFVPSELPFPADTFFFKGHYYHNLFSLEFSQSLLISAFQDCFKCMWGVLHA